MKSSGAGTLTQLSGNNTVDELLITGWSSRGVGTYDLRGGTLTATTIGLGNGEAHFKWSGGTLRTGEFVAPHRPLARLSNAGTGTLAPGNPIGQTEVFADYVQGPDASLVIEGQGDGHDQLHVAGDVWLDGTLSLLVIGKLSLPGLPWGDLTGTIVTSNGPNGIIGTFAETPSAGDHLGYGVFLTEQGVNGHGIAYSTQSVLIDIFQAAAGDADGNRDVNGFDIQAILSASKFGKPLAADWTEGDFTGDGFVNGFDIQAILSANQFGKGPYAVAAGGVNAVPEPSTMALLLSTLAGLALPTVHRFRRA